MPVPGHLAVKTRLKQIGHRPIRRAAGNRRGLSVEHAVNLLRQEAAAAASEAEIDDDGPEPGAPGGEDEAPAEEKHG